MSSVAVKVLSTVNAPYGTNLSAEELAAKISDPASVENYDASAFSFYSEVSGDLQHQFLDEMEIDHSVVAEIAEKFSQLAGYTAAQRSERHALAMTGQQAAAFRFEQQMLVEAQRSGITLTDQQRQEIAALAQGMASADASVQTYVVSQEQAVEVSRFFGEQAVDALSGLLSGTMSAEEALQNLIQDPQPKINAMIAAWKKRPA